MSEGLSVLQLNFVKATQSLIFETGDRRAIKSVSVHGCVLRVVRKLTQTFRPPLPKFYRGGAKNSKFGLDFRLQWPLKHTGSETEQHIGNLKHALWAQMIAPYIGTGISPINRLIIFTENGQKL